MGTGQLWLVCSDPPWTGQCSPPALPEDPWGPHKPPTETHLRAAQASRLSSVPPA